MPYFVTDDGYPIYYEEHGDRNDPTVLFVHGLSATHGYFRYQLPALVDHYHVVTYDVRGHGASDKTNRNLTIAQMGKELNELMQYLELDHVALAGWSFGVNVVLSYVEQFGCGRLFRLVLMDNTPKMLSDETWPYGVYADPQAALNDVAFMAKDWKGYAEICPDAFFGQGAQVPDEMYRWVHDHILENELGPILSLFVSNVTGDVRGALPKINVPTLLTYGKLPSYCTYEIMSGVASFIADARVEGFNGGHLHFMQDADNFNRVLIDFIESGNKK